jgi:hypothetical protein
MDNQEETENKKEGENNTVMKNIKLESVDRHEKRLKKAGIIYIMYQSNVYEVG